MVKPKTLKYKKKYNKRFTNKRKNNKFRHTKKIYKKKRHTTLKHKKIQRGGIRTAPDGAPVNDAYLESVRRRIIDNTKERDRTPSGLYDTNTDLIATAKEIEVFKDSIRQMFTQSNIPVPENIEDELAKILPTMNPDQREIEKERLHNKAKVAVKETLERIEQDKTNQESAQAATNDSTYMFTWLYSYLSSLGTDSLKRLREMIDDLIEARRGGGGT
tara:strand:- start:2128 stop:2778 length:651 start_codon:yes stop_codon:yes gene_type:complete